MTTTATRRAALSCALLASTCTMPLPAQTVGESISSYVGPPAEKLAITPGGVDIRTGRYAYTQTDLSIGGEGESGGLTLTRTMIGPVAGSFGNFSHNWDIIVQTKRVDIDTGNYADGSGEDYRVSVHFGGRSETFESQSYNSGFQQVSQSSTATLTYTSDRNGPNVVYTFEATDGTIVRFRPGGFAFVSELVLPDGTRLSFDYETPPAGVQSWPRLRSVTSTRGYGMLLEYGGSGGGWAHVAKACVINLTQVTKPANNVCPANVPTSTYSYTQFRGTRLATATNPTGATFSFSYGDASGQLQMGFIKPGETSAWMTNVIREGSTAQGEPVQATESQSFSTGEHYSYEYDTGFEQTGGTVDNIAGGAFTNALGETTQVRYAFPRRPQSLNPKRLSPWGEPQENLGDAYFQVTPGPVSITDPLGRVTSFDYCDPYMAQALPATDSYRCVVSQLHSYTDPEGGRTELSYGGGRVVTGVRRKAKPGSGLADIVISATYQCSNRKTCVRPNQVTDAKGNVSNATYAPEHGGVLTETGPAVNGVRPQTRNTYAQRHAWILNGSGYVQAGPPVWLLTETSFCRTSSATGYPSSPCSASGDEVRTIYDYGPDSGPNNLLLRGTVVNADGQSLRTCRSYDALGRMLSETKPRANLSACP